MRLSHVSKVVVFLMMFVVLAACGNSTNGGNTNTSTESNASTSEASVSAAAEKEATTRKISTPSGEVEIPANPKKIVTDGYLPELLVLGVKPVGSTAWELENKVIQDQIQGIKSTGERSFEAMLALEPDLIVTWTSEKNIIEQYEKIAPTISIPYGHYKDIHDTMRFFGEALGKANEAEQWLADFDKTVAESRAQLAGIVKPEDTFALMGVFVVDKGFYIYADGGYRGGEAIYRHLQLTPPAKQKQEMVGKEQYKQISYEVVGDYAGDYIFLDQGDMIKEVWGKNDGIWKTLDAVKNNRVFQLDPNLFWGNDPISLKLQIQEVVKMLSERAKQS